MANLNLNSIRYIIRVSGSITATELYRETENGAQTLNDSVVVNYENSTTEASGLNRVIALLSNDLSRIAGGQFFVADKNRFFISFHLNDSVALRAIGIRNQVVKGVSADQIVNNLVNMRQKWSSNATVSEAEKNAYKAFALAVKKANDMGIQVRLNGVHELYAIRMYVNEFKNGRTVRNYQHADLASLAGMEVTPKQISVGENRTVLVVDGAEHIIFDNNQFSMGRTAEVVETTINNRKYYSIVKFADPHKDTAYSELSDEQKKEYTGAGFFVLLDKRASEKLPQRQAVSVETVETVNEI